MGIFGGYRVCMFILITVERVCSGDFMGMSGKKPKVDKRPFAGFGCMWNKTIPLLTNPMIVWDFKNPLIACMNVSCRSGLSILLSLMVLLEGLTQEIDQWFIAAESLLA